MRKNSLSSGKLKLFKKKTDEMLLENDNKSENENIRIAVPVEVETQTENNLVQGKEAVI